MKNLRVKLIESKLLNHNSSVYFNLFKSFGDFSQSNLFVLQIRNGERFDYDAPRTWFQTQSEAHKWLHGVYAEFDGHGIELSTERCENPFDAMGTTTRHYIVLEPEQMLNLKNFEIRLMAELQRQKNIADGQLDLPTEDTHNA